MEESLVFDGRWQLGAVLARGRFSVVFEAQDLRGAAPSVAVKLHTARYLDGAAAKARFLAAAQALRGRDHPHLVRVLDVGARGDNLYLVMERIHGRTLAELLVERGRLPLGEVVAIAADLLEGLAFLHAAGRTHRDVKPSNVMLDARGRAVLIDLGLLGAGDVALEAHGTVEGTPEYMAPEQSRSLELADARSDVYGAGATLYALLVGRPPFVGASPEELFRMHHEEDPVKPSKLVPGLARAVDKVFLRALAKKPSRRWESAAAFRAALASLVPG